MMKTRTISLTLVLSLTVLVTVWTVMASTSENFGIPLYTTDSSGGVMTSQSYQLNYIVGQPIYGDTASANQQIALGFESASGVSLATPLPPTATPAATPTPTVTPQPASILISRINGGVLNSPNVTVDFPPESVLFDTLVTYENRPSQSEGVLTGVNEFFDLEATQNGQTIIDFELPVLVTVRLTDLGAVKPESLQLYWRDGNEWSTSGITTVSRTSNELVSETTHFTLFAVLGQTDRFYLPLILRNDNG